MEFLNYTQTSNNHVIIFVYILFLYLISLIYFTLPIHNFIDILV